MTPDEQLDRRRDALHVAHNQHDRGEDCYPPGRHAHEMRQLRSDDICAGDNLVTEIRFYCIHCLLVIDANGLKVEL